MKTYKYNPDRKAEWNYGGAKWRLSRSKIDLFIECPRCFYLDNKLGTKRPGFPSFNLNIAVDELFKKEFDAYREKGEPHPIMTKNGLEAVPFQHKEMDKWRENFEGVEFKDDVTGFTISGAIDDVWVTKDDELIMVDYKSTSKDGSITALSDSPWDQQYKRQLGVYKWLLEQNGFKVSGTGYLVYANASKSEATFSDKLVFETTLVEVPIETDWIDKVLDDIKNCLESEDIPVVGTNCEFCPYREACGKKLMRMHQNNLAKAKSQPDNEEDMVKSSIAATKSKYQK